MKYDAGIVLAHWLTPDGSLSDELRERVDRGIELWKEKKLGYLIMTGDHKLRGQKFLFSLSEAMKKYAVQKGVKAEKIIEQNIDLETVGNLLFSKYGIIEPRGWKKLVIIPPDYHVPRARELADFIFGEGYSLDYSPVDSGGLEDSSNSITLFREMVKGIKPGDTKGILERVFERHGRYNVEPDFFRSRLEKLRKEQMALAGS